MPTTLVALCIFSFFITIIVGLTIHLLIPTQKDKRFIARFFRSKIKKQKFDK